MADRLVQEHAAEPVSDDHRKAPGGSVNRVEQRQRPARGLLRHRLGIALDELPAGVPAAGVGAGLDPALVPGDHLGAQPDTGAVVRRGAALRVEDLDLPARLRVPDARLGNLRPDGPGVLVAGSQQIRLAGGCHLVRARLDRVAARPGRGGQGGRLARSAAQRLRDRARDAQEVLLGDAVDVAVVGRVAVHHPHARTSLAPALRTLDAAVVERDRKALAGLGVELGEVAPAAERAREHRGGERRFDERHSSSSFALGSSSSTSATIRSAVSRTRS